MTSEDPETLPEALVRAAERHPDRGIGLVDARGRSEGKSFAELLTAARDTAAALAARGVAPRDPVLICLPTSWDFLDAWFGAVLAGAWPAVVAAPGALGSSAQALERIADLLEHLDTRFLVCGPSLEAEARKLGQERIYEAAIEPSELFADGATAGPNRPVLPTTAPSDVAFLQLTSGSTGRSRGVMITHRSALHNCRAIDAAVGETRGGPAHTWMQSLVSWLPLSHDMGLVGCVLHALTCGTQLWLSTPRNFLGRPHSWLQLIGRSGPCVSTAPNFAYQTCVERVRAEHLEGVDLSGWRAALVGAETVRPETMQAFAQAFGRAGFAREALLPCYGLAEASLAVTFDQRGLGPRSRDIPAADGSEHRGVVCVGEPVADTELRICAPDGAPLGERAIGEVWVSGPSVFAGYYRDERVTRETLRDGWLRTGDLGTLFEGELWITGRIKDLIIVHGQNVMPHELEWIAESVTAGGGSRRAAAFAVTRTAEGAAASELAVVAVELEASQTALAELEQEIRVRVGRSLSMPLADVVFVRRGALPKTTSGKVQRSEVQRRYRAGELEGERLVSRVRDTFT